ncbi:cupin-like domain-containing protein [Micromonospora sp. WMMD734]|uniref:cupin-like domain-containing protein n=1 Tax=Micromonospora sp. WMMD734 TaxID=3404129 RepID=UPI003B92F785
MQIEDNILRRYDVDSMNLVEAAFVDGPLADAMSAAPSVERRKDVTPEEFVHTYRDRNRPVVLEGFVSHWPAVRNWSFAHLAERCGTVKVVVDSYTSARARETTVAEFVELLKTNVGPGASPIYLQEWLYQASCPDLAEDLPELDIAQYDFRRNLYGDDASVNHQLWLGQQGGITRLHQDSYTVDVMHAQIVGTKRWYIMSPDAELRRNADGEPDWSAFRSSPDVELMQFDLRPGDFLFLPAAWYHRIELLTDSIGLGRKALDVKNLQKHMHQRMAELLGLLLNYDEVSRTHPELVPVLMARSRILANRMNIDLSNLRP